MSKHTPGPFDGRLSIYLDDEWICGISDPQLLERALVAIENIIEMSLPRGKDAVDALPGGEQ